MAGRFIVVEGIDGCGKGTAISLLEKSLRDLDMDVVCLQGFGTGAIGSRLRLKLFSGDLPPALASSVMPIALLDCYDVIKAYLDLDYIVLVDRFIASYYAYNCTAYDDTVAKLNFERVFNGAKDTFRFRTDILINIDLDKAEKRRMLRSGESNYIDKHKASFFKKATVGYKNYYLNASNTKLINLDNNGSLDDLRTQINNLTRLLLCVDGYH
jgi:dTMP kinase